MQSDWGCPHCKNKIDYVHTNCETGIGHAIDCPNVEFELDEDFAEWSLFHFDGQGADAQMIDPCHDCGKKLEENCQCHRKKFYNRP